MNKEFQSMNINLNILIRKNHNEIIIFNIYVNDFLITNKTMQKIHYTKTVFNETFKMLNLKKAQIIVDLRMIRNRNKYTLMLNQILYIMKVLLEKEMRNCLYIEIFMKSELFITLNKMNNIMKASSINMQ